MNTYCSSCGSKNEWSAVKPVKCEICNEPFVRKVVAAAPARRQSDARDINNQRFQEIDEDIPTSFDLITDAPARNARGRKVAPSFEKISSIGKDGRAVVVDSTGQQIFGSFERNAAPSDPELTKAKQEALKHMLPGGGGSR